MRDASGQATIEWVGLVLVAALVLGALAALRAPAQDRELGAVLARRITCAAGAACADAPAGRRPPAPLSALPVAPSPPLRERAAPRAKAVDAFRRLRGVGKLTNRIWIVCLGHRRWAYEREHVRGPGGTMPLGEALEAANTCLNPLSFLDDGDG
jgi:hypothetical protein